jgi:hypothetical protein
MIAAQFACHRLVKLESFLFNHSVTWARSIRHTPELKVHALASRYKKLDATARDGRSLFYAVTSRGEVIIYRQLWSDGNSERSCVH